MNRAAAAVAGVVMLVVATPASAGHVTVYDRCAGAQGEQATVALSLSLPAGSGVGGMLYGEMGDAQASGTVDTRGIVELRFTLPGDGGFYEWIAYDQADSSHEIATGGLDASQSQPCSGSQLQPAPATPSEDPTPEPSPSPDVDGEPSEEPTEQEDRDSEQPAVVRTPVLPPAPADVVGGPQPGAPPSGEPPGPTGDGTAIAVEEPPLELPAIVDDPSGLELPGFADGDPADFGGAVAVGPVGAPQAGVVLDTASPQALGAGVDHTDWFVFLTGIALVVVLSGGIPLKQQPQLTAERLVGKNWT